MKPNYDFSEILISQNSNTRPSCQPLSSPSKISTNTSQTSKNYPVNYIFDVN